MARSAHIADTTQGEPGITVQVLFVNRKMILDRRNLHGVLLRLLAHIGAVVNTIALPPVPRAVLVLDGHGLSPRCAPTD